MIFRVSNFSNLISRKITNCQFFLFKVKIEDDVKKEVDDGDDSDDGSSSDEDDYQPRRKKRAHPSRWTFNPNEDILMPEDVTDAMLDDTISDFVSNKVSFASYEKFVKSNLFF